jgi:carbon storage regulator
MLVLTRRNQESVVVGGADKTERLLKVTVLQVRGSEVSLGFEGPPQIAVHRLEVWERIRAGARPDRLFQRPAAHGT